MTNSRIDEIREQLSFLNPDGSWKCDPPKSLLNGDIDRIIPTYALELLDEITRLQGALEYAEDMCIRIDETWQQAEGVSFSDYAHYAGESPPTEIEAERFREWLNLPRPRPTLKQFMEKAGGE